MSVGEVTEHCNKHNECGEPLRRATVATGPRGVERRGRVTGMRVAGGSRCERATRANLFARCSISPSTMIEYCARRQSRRNEMCAPPGGRQQREMNEERRQTDRLAVTAVCCVCAPSLVAPAPSLTRLDSAACVCAHCLSARAALASEQHRRAERSRAEQSRGRRGGCPFLSQPACVFS